MAESRVRISEEVAAMLNTYANSLGLNQSQVASIAIADWLSQRGPNLGTLCPGLSEAEPASEAGKGGQEVRKPVKPPGAPPQGVSGGAGAGQIGHTLATGGGGVCAASQPDTDPDQSESESGWLEEERKALSPEKILRALNIRDPLRSKVLALEGLTVEEMRRVYLGLDVKEGDRGVVMCYRLFDARGIEWKDDPRLSAGLQSIERMRRKRT